MAIILGRRKAPGTFALDHRNVKQRIELCAVVDKFAEYENHSLEALLSLERKQAPILTEHP